MNKYKLTYGRLVVLERIVEAKDEYEAEDIANAMDENNDLNIGVVALDKDSVITAVIGDDDVWYIGLVA